MRDRLPDSHPAIEVVSALRAVRPRPATRSARYLPMPDGARIAVDIHLPKDLAAGEQLPTIVRQTRYFRSVHVRPPFGALGVDRIPDLYFDTRKLFVSHGYAWVDVDVRGTGASFGDQPYPWADREVADGRSVVDWIVSQPWSNGRVGSLGISYDGTTAEMLATNNHPAVRAVAPMFSLFDVFADVAFPGGHHLRWFTGVWSRFNRTLDANRYPSAMAQALWLMFEAGRAGTKTGIWRQALSAVKEPLFLSALATGFSPIFGSVRPVDDDPSGATLADAIRDHEASFDIHEGALKVGARDDVGLLDRYPDRDIDALSPHTRIAASRDGGAAIFSVGGFRDGAYQHAAVKRFRTVKTPGSRLLLGPTGHAGKIYCSPAHPARPSAFDVDAELLRFFDWHLRERDHAFSSEPLVRYYTTGREAWTTAADWPPPGARQLRLHFASDRSLRADVPPAGAAELRVDRATGTGPRSRWRGLLGHMIAPDYPDRRQRDKALLTFTSEPISRAMTVSGHPILTIFLRASAPDLVLFAYLEEVRPSGDVWYITEGQLRACHRALDPNPPYDTPAPIHSFRGAHKASLAIGEVESLAFDLLPCSHEFSPGSRVRLAIAGADADHFAPPPYPEAGAALLCGGAHPSYLDLPTEDP